MLKLRYIGAASVALLAAGCASDPYHDAYYTSPSYYSPPAYVASTGPYYAQAVPADFGRVVAIDVARERGGTTGAGAVVGGIVGGVLGHQVGSGRGQDAATVAGAIGGAVAGNEIEKRRADGPDHYRITVRFSDGREATFAQDSLHGLRVGDRVRVDGGRVVPG